MAKVVSYSMDGSSFESLGINVSSAKGLFSLPKLKAPQSVDWPDKNGVFVDLTKPRYQPREITLHCWSSGSNGAEAVGGATALYSILTGQGLHTLSVTIGQASFSYSVYCEDGIDVTKRWGGGKVIAEFEVKLKEPKPSAFVPSDTENNN